MQIYAVTIRQHSPRRLARAREARARAWRSLGGGALVCLATAVAVQAALPNFTVINDQSAGKSKLKFAPRPISDDQPVLLNADNIEYDRETSTVIASGRVEVSQGETVLIADRVTYHQKTGRVMAVGNVSVLEPTGHVYFAEQVELVQMLRAGAIKQFKARMSDNSLFAANEAFQPNDKRVQLKQAVYSPCYVAGCENPLGNKTPLWQLRANDVLHDKERKRVVYHDAYFEVFGVPVVYTPYLSHASPGAESESGLLPPTYGHSTNLGSVLKLPVFIAIAGDRDLTLTPIITGEDGIVMQANYRQRFDTGRLFFEGSITNPDARDAQGNITSGNELRWHVNSSADFSPDAETAWGYALRRTSDDTYLRRYDFNYEEPLTSRLYWESIAPIEGSGRSWAKAEGLAFQGLAAADIAKQSPYALPLATMYWQSEPDAYGARWDMNANLLNLIREEGVESRRLSLASGWALPYITPEGHVFSLAANLRGDFYSVNNVQLGNGALDDGVAARVIPLVSAGWRYPLVTRFENSSLLVEPVLDFIVSPNLGNDEKIPNEDSRVPEFSDANLFSSNRFPGYDRVENGPRMNYGVRGQYDWRGEVQVSTLLGQSYRTRNDRRFPLSNDLTSKASDYVGSLGVTTRSLDVAYRFRMDQSDHMLSRSEWIASYNRYPVGLVGTYLKIDNDPILGSKEEIAGAASFNLSRNWRAALSARRDLQASQLTSAGVGLTYVNECTALGVVAQRDYTRDRDIEPDKSIFFTFSLKNLN